MSEKGYRYNRIKELYDYEFIRVFRKLFYNSLHVLSDKEIDELLEKEVFSNPLFQKDLETTYKALEHLYSRKLVEKVIKHYITSIMRFIFKSHEYRIKIVVIKSFALITENNIFRRTSKYYYKKHHFLLGIRRLTLRKKTFNKNYLKTEDYE